MMESHSHESARTRASFSPEELSGSTTAFLMEVEGASNFQEDSYADMTQRVKVILKRHEPLLSYSGLTVQASNLDVHYEDISLGGEEAFDTTLLDETMVRVCIAEREKFLNYLVALPKKNVHEREDIQHLLHLVSHEYRYHAYDGFHHKTKGDMSDTFYAVLYKGEEYTKLFSEKLSVPGKEVTIHNNFDLYFLYAGAVTTKEGVVKNFFETYGMLNEDKLAAQFDNRQKYLEEVEMAMRATFAVFFQENLEDGEHYTTEDDLEERDNKYAQFIHELAQVAAFVQKASLGHLSHHAVTPFLLYATGQLTGFLRAFEVIMKNGGEDNAAWMNSRVLEVSGYIQKYTGLVEGLLAKEILSVVERKKLEQALSDMKPR